MTTLEQLDAKSLPEFLEADLAVLMLSKTDCAACSAWTTELEGFLAEAGDDLGGARFGKLRLDTPGLVAFKRANPWLAEVDVLPFNVIFKGGEAVKKWPGGGLPRLKGRLEAVKGD